MKVRKLPVTVEAFQITRETRRNNADWPDWLNRAWNLDTSAVGAVYPLSDESSDGPLMIRTLEGNHICDLGDWIIRGVKGELYSCKPEIFAITYEIIGPE